MGLIHEPRKLPMVLSAVEVQKIIDAAGSLKYRAALSVAYGVALRASEVDHLERRGRTARELTFAYR